MRDFTRQPMFLMPDAALGAQRRTVNGSRTPLLRPRLEEDDQMTSQTTDQRRQARRQSGQASLPSPARRETSIFAQQYFDLPRQGVVLLQEVEQGISRIKSPNDHDHQRFDKELVGIGFLPPALSLRRRRRRWHQFDEPE